MLTNIPFKPDKEALMEKLRIFPDTEEADDFAKLVEQAEKAGKPKALYTVSFIEERREDGITLDGVFLTSRVLVQNLAEVERVFPFVATCGVELDDIFLPEDDFIKRYWLDEIKVAALDAAGSYLLAHLQHRFALNKLSTMSPGSGDIDLWHIEQQRHLFKILGNTECDIGVRLTESCMMIPTKSISGICFPTKLDFRICQLCHRENCPSRTAPFDEDLWKMFSKD